MATTIPNFLTPKVVCNLDTYNYTIGTAGLHLVTAQFTIPQSSALSIALKQGSTTVITSTAPASTDRVVNVSCTVNASVSDVIGFVVTSANAVDKQLNAVKGILRVDRTPSQN